MTIFKKLNIILFIKISIIISLLTKLFLVGDGFLAFPDENRYFASEEVINSVKERDFNGAIKAIFSTQGRPGEVLTKTIPVYLQILSHQVLHTYKFSPENTFPLFLFNYTIFLLILLQIYWLGGIMFNNSNYALFLVLLYSLCTNSFIYLRHALPYDTSLLIFLFVIYKIVQGNYNFFLVGFLAFFGYLTYPGYVFLFGFIATLVLFYKVDVVKNIKCLNFVKFLLGALICLLLFEITARLAGVSYLYSASKLSGTITQGDFNESFTFLPKYLFEVEKFTGVFILIIFIISLYIIPRFEKRITSFVVLTFLFLIFGYLTWASLGYFLHKVVFYGRLIHMYLPFLCMIVVYVLYKLESEFRINFKILISLLLICQYIFTFYEYRKLGYPRDEVFMISKKTNEKNFENISSLIQDLYFPPRLNQISIENLNSKKGKYITVNYNYFYPVVDSQKISLDSYYNIYSIKHFSNFKAYQYEGYSQKERDIIDREEPLISLYKKINTKKTF